MLKEFELKYGRERKELTKEETEERYKEWFGDSEENFSIEQ